MARAVDLNSDVGEGFGAWPGGPDRELMNIITSAIRYVKPRGALYNTIVRHDEQANAVANAVRLFDPTLPLLGLPGTDSAIERAAADHGLTFCFEGFADRGYAADGTLIPRGQPGALLTDDDAAANQALDLAGRGITSICLHSDTPGAVGLAAAVAVGLLQGGYELRAFTR